MRYPIQSKAVFRNWPEEFHASTLAEIEQHMQNGSCKSHSKN